MTFGTIYIPFDRMATLLSVEGELKRAGILPPAGFGGMRNAWLKLWQAEGLAGCMRSALITPLLRFPTRFLGDLFATSFFHLCNRYTFHAVIGLIMAMEASVCIAAPYNVLQRCIRTIYRADIKVPKEQSHKTPHSNDPLPFTQKVKRYIGDVLKGSQRHVAYPFGGVVNIAKTIKRKFTLKSHLSLVGFEILYKNIFVLAVPVVYDILPILRLSTPLHAATLVARDVLAQPFRVILGRMAVNIAIDEKQQRRNGDGVMVTESMKPYTSVLDCAQTIVREDGVRGLWAGLRYRLLLSSLAWVCFMLAPPAASDL